MARTFAAVGREGDDPPARQVQRAEIRPGDARQHQVEQQGRAKEQIEKQVVRADPGCVRAGREPREVPVKRVNRRRQQ